MAREAKGGDYFKYFRQTGVIIRGMAIIRRNTVYCYVQCYKNAWYCPFPFRTLFFLRLLNSAELICFSPYILARV